MKHVSRNAPLEKIISALLHHFVRPLTMQPVKDKIEHLVVRYLTGWASFAVA